VSGQFQAPAGLSPGKILGIRWIGDWVGPRSSLEEVAKGKIFDAAGCLTVVVRPSVSQLTALSSAYTHSLSQSFCHSVILDDENVARNVYQCFTHLCKFRLSHCPPVSYLIQTRWRCILGATHGNGLTWHPHYAFISYAFCNWRSKVGDNELWTCNRVEYGAVTWRWWDSHVASKHSSVYPASLNTIDSVRGASSIHSCESSDWLWATRQGSIPGRSRIFLFASSITRPILGHTSPI
jgi:hypothetical protein